MTEFEKETTDKWQSQPKTYEHKANAGLYINITTETAQNTAVLVPYALQQAQFIWRFTNFIPMFHYIYLYFVFKRLHSNST